MLLTDTCAPARQPEEAMYWQLSHRTDPRGAALADRHYSRKTVRAAQFVPTERCLVLLTAAGDALWVSSWPYDRYARHEWRGARLCSLFRNQSDVLSSTLITQAVATTCWQWGQPLDLGMITFVDTTQVRKKHDPGRCFRQAGWRQVGFTKSGLVVLQLLPQAMPPALPASGTQLFLFPTKTEVHA